MAKFFFGILRIIIKKKLNPSFFFAPVSHNSKTFTSNMAKRNQRKETRTSEKI